MFGLLLQAFGDYVKHRFGQEKWEAVLTNLGYGPEGFEPLFPYDAALFFRVVAEVCKKLDIAPRLLLEGLGGWIISGDHAGRVRKLLRFGGKDFPRFLASLPELPERMRLTLPLLNLPDVDVVYEGDGEYRLISPAARMETGWMLVGGLREMARDYGTEAVVSEVAHTRGVEIKITIEEPRSGSVVTPFAGARRLDARLLTLSEASLSAAVPLYVIVSHAGQITGHSQLLQRLNGPQPLLGKTLAEIFEPWGARAAFAEQPDTDLVGYASVRLRVKSTGYRLRGLRLPLALGDETLFVLSLGLDSLRAVEALGLTEDDFSVTDVAMDLQALAQASALIVSGMQAMGQRLENARRAAEAEALTDPLTGLKNRRGADSFLAKMCRRAEGFCVMMLDLDWFKEVNDRFGHLVGDAVLRDVAVELQRLTRRKDCIARVGGDEFALILPELSNAARVGALAQAILEAVGRSREAEGESFKIGASIGVLQVDTGVSPAPETVISACDAALYRAKEQGRNQVVFAQPLIRGM